MLSKKVDHPGAEKAPRKTKAPKQLAVIDQKGCTGCHACVPLCPVDCIENVPGPEHPDFMRVVEIDYERCIGCAICADYCPWETIFMIPEPEAESKAKAWTVRSVIYNDVVEGEAQVEKPAEDQPTVIDKVEDK